MNSNEKIGDVLCAHAEFIGAANRGIQGCLEINRSAILDYEMTGDLPKHLGPRQLVYLMEAAETCALFVDERLMRALGSEYGLLRGAADQDENGGGE